MQTTKPTLAGVELYFDDLERAKKFYQDTLGLSLSEEDTSRYYQFDTGSAFLCLEKNGVENYPSANKAVLFLELSDLAGFISKIGRERFVGFALVEQALARLRQGRDRRGARHGSPDGYSVTWPAVCGGCGSGRCGPLPRQPFSSAG